jgi:carboxy-cis,cis-muconate cyclase
MPKHHLMVGTWTPPGAIFTFEFDDESLELKLVNRTEIPKEEPISWMTFSVRLENEQNERAITKTRLLA